MGAINNCILLSLSGRMAMLLFACFACTGLNAQGVGEEYLGAWYMYFGNYKIAPQWTLYTEAQLRNYQATSNTQQSLFALGAFRELNNKNKVGAGYALLPSESFNQDVHHTTALEHRAWETFILQNQIQRIGIRHRYQLEQRWVSKNDEAFDYLNRVRYQLLISVPINRAQMEAHTFYGILGEEIFLHLQEDPFDQNRLHLGLGYKLNEQLNFQVGYMHWNLRDWRYERWLTAILISV